MWDNHFNFNVSKGWRICALASLDQGDNLAIPALLPNESITCLVNRLLSESNDYEQICHLQITHGFFQGDGKFIMKVENSCIEVTQNRSC